ncbi:spherulation-specific family 4 protein [Streptomyces sp. NPDC005820]|uniref:spherulation-specific family 4 protein n=1 Tax=Streptomyces sp. NPDC005820 TaxID=3157069 RepID=UPI00340A00A4
MFGLQAPAATAATSSCGIDVDSATGFTSTQVDGFAVTSRVGCASDAPSDIAALTTSGKDVVMTADYTGGDASAEIKAEVDAFHTAQAGGQTLSQYFDARASKYSLHLYDGATSADGVTFDGNVYAVGNSLVVVVPAAQVSATANFWQKVVAGVVGWAVGVIVTAGCLAFFNVGSVVAAPLCGAAGGFLGSMASELMQNVVFDKRPITDRSVLAETFAVALLGAAIGGSSGAVLNWAEGNSRAITSSIQTYLKDLITKFKAWANPLNLVRSTLDGFDIELVNAIRSRVTVANQQIAVASYIYPTDSAWTRLINSPSSKTSVVVANVLNGPGSAKDSSWGDVIDRAAASGKKVLGYVDTGYFGLADNRATRLGSTAPADWTQQIEEDVNAWYSLYGSSMGGIFFDDGYNECGAGNVVPSWYTEINDYVKRTHPGALTVLNPGTVVPQCYEGTADVLLTYEGDYTGYVGTNSNPALNYKDLGWNPKSPSEIWHIIYGVSADHIAEVAAVAKARGAGYVEITDDVMANPYDTLPADSYWNAEQNAVDGGTPTVAGPTPYAGATGTPAAPSGLTVKSYDYTSATLGWTGVAGAARYEISVNGVITTVPGSMTTATVGGLTPGGSSYQIKVLAQSSGGTESAPSNTVTVTTLSLPGGKTVSNVKVSATATTATISADFLVPYSFRRLYFWTPVADFTGCGAFAWTINYQTASYVCGYYMVEGTTLYKYTGTADSQWSWSPMGTVSISRSGYTYTWNVPYGTSGGVSADHVVLQAEGYNPLVNYFTPCNLIVFPAGGPDGNGRYCA